MSTFARYKDSDALCCPSATSSATYSIVKETFGAPPVLMLDSVFTNPTGS
jgi:hypothetical protein